ncbi:cell adhesion molecule Dscam1, partial [Parasteatoda tepidariorum]|uniref:cell adhesion molecule Dscam1 n=1 Tax=Parasteatoda tepidariorum TaxID=114398 RepID=UPI001C718B5E
MLHYKTDDGHWEQLRLSNIQDHYSLGGLRCGTRYHLYMTASNSLGSGEPSVEVTTRTLGAAPMSPHGSHFLSPNTTFVVLNLGAWQSGGCPIKHFEIQYRPKYISQWSKVVEKLEMPRDVYFLRNLSPDREYEVMVTAHSDAGLTQAEYSFRTASLNPLAPTSSPAFGKRETDVPFYKNVTLVVPIVVSSLVLVIIIFIIVVCLRKHSDERDGRLGQAAERFACLKAKPILVGSNPVQGMDVSLCVVSCVVRDEGMWPTLWTGMCDSVAWVMLSTLRLWSQSAHQLTLNEQYFRHLTKQER